MRILETKIQEKFEKIQRWLIEIWKFKFQFFFTRLWANGKFQTLLPPTVMILFQPNLFWMLPTKPFLNAPYNRPRKSYLLGFWTWFFFKKVEIFVNIIRDPVGRKISKCYSYPRWGFFFSWTFFVCSLWQSSQELPNGILKLSDLFIYFWKKDWKLTL